MQPHDQRQLELIQVGISGIEAELKTLNGKVVRHDEEIFGDASKGSVGLRAEMNEIHDVKTGIKAVVWFFGFVGIANILTLITLWQHV